MTITMDSREAEQHPRILRGLQKKHVVSVELLKFGDYFVRGLKKNVVVERKTVGDFLQSWGGRRIFEQLIGLKSVENAEPRLLLEGSLDEARHYSRWQLHSLAGMLVSVEEDWKIPIFSIPSVSWVSRYITGLARNIEEEKVKKLYPLRHKPRMRTMAEKARCVVEGFRGVGPVLADMLLRHRGSVKGVCLASPEELAVLGKLPLKRAKQIFAIINYPYGNKVEKQNSNT